MYNLLEKLLWELQPSPFLPPPPMKMQYDLGKMKNKTNQCGLDASGTYNSEIADLEGLFSTASHICVRDRWDISLAIRKEIA